MEQQLKNFLIKERSAMSNIQKIIEKLLWDFPIEDRKLDQYSKPVLKRRSRQLPSPESRALENIISYKEMAQDRQREAEALE
jgi:hypothetical protein